MTTIVHVVNVLQRARTLRWLSVVFVAGFTCIAAMGATLDEIKKRGYMIVATEDDYPPFEYVVNGKPMGYDHALLAILKKSAPFEIRQEILPWQGILPGVASGKYDVALSAAVITDDRGDGALSIIRRMPLTINPHVRGNLRPTKLQRVGEQLRPG